MNVRCVCTNGWDSIRSKNSPQGFGRGTPGENLASDSALNMPVPSRRTRFTVNGTKRPLGIVGCRLCTSALFGGAHAPSNHGKTEPLPKSGPAFLRAMQSMGGMAETVPLRKLAERWKPLPYLEA